MIESVLSREQFLRSSVAGLSYGAPLGKRNVDYKIIEKQNFVILKGKTYAKNSLLLS